MSERADTKTRILDSAEKLFGLNGFEATSLRDITTAADVNLAAVNYHFQSKESLIDAVIARRIEPVNAQRLELLDALGPDATLEQVLAAFLRPVIGIRLETAVPLMGRILSNPEVFAERMFHQHFADVSRRFMEAFLRAVPGLTTQQAAWRLHFTVGLVTHTMLWGRVMPRLSGGLCDIADREALLDRTVQFAAAGFRAAASNALHGGHDRNA